MTKQFLKNVFTGILLKGFRKRFLGFFKNFKLNVKITLAQITVV